MPSARDPGQPPPPHRNPKPAPRAPGGAAKPAPPPDQPADARHAGERILRRFHEGVLALHERRSGVRFVVESASGAIVLPVEPGFAKSLSDELVLFVPGESEQQANIALSPELIARPEAEEACDRWAAYHGKATHNAWIRGTVDGLKTESAVYGPDECAGPNPLGRAEYALIRHANADRAALSAACKRFGAMPVADPLAVGADPLGIDVRARFGILRLEFPDGVFADTPEKAQREVDRLLGRTPGGSGAT